MIIVADCLWYEIFNYDIGSINKFLLFFKTSCSL